MGSNIAVHVCSLGEECITSNGKNYSMSIALLDVSGINIIHVLEHTTAGFCAKVIL